MSAGLLHYRPWRGEFRAPVWGFWPVARTALTMIFRRKLFWALYGMGLMMFLLYFFGQYLFAWAEAQGGAARLENMPGPGGGVVRLLRNFLKLDGSGENFGSFIRYQIWIVMAVLGLAGSVLVGNDLHHGSLPFYLSKPLSRWHYLLGKFLAVGVFINMLTTLPALVLWVQFGLLYNYWYLIDGAWLAAGIVGYGAVLTLCLGLMILATAMWMQRTAPMIMAWTTVFVFFRLLANILVDRLRQDVRWRLLDLWGNMNLLGRELLGIELEPARAALQPAWTDAALVLGGVCLVCLTYLVLRIRAVEVVN